MYKLLNGDCREVLKTLLDNSIDSIVTDPPYELGFMGKAWDSTGIAFNTEVWRECLRVLKPGGHLLAFSGSRTYHRMAVAIEDAGFEIRDQIMWIYGSGFPKSLDISKAIDKSDAVEKRIARQLEFCSWMRSTGLTSSKATEILRNAKVITENGTMAGHFFATSIQGQPAVATAEIFDALRPYLPEVPDYIEEMVRQRTIESENFKKREVVGSKTSGIGTAFGDGEWASAKAQEVDITAPATAAAKQWQGWGTALKPAHEPLVLARKPIQGTVANNVLIFGVGGLNIDATRVRFSENETDNRVGTDFVSNGGDASNNANDNQVPNKHYVQMYKAEGRFPANVIHDGSDEVVELFGEPARFFYCAKASKRDRNEGLDEFEAIRVHDGRADGKVGEDNPRNRSNHAKVNHHPTVKPTDLMRYLCRLITPPNGIVLDPFNGSGSTGKACMYEGFQYIGIEQDEQYYEIAKARIEFALQSRKDTLF